MNKILTEITPLTKQDSFYMFDHLKESYDFPLHNHPEYELSFMENCTGVHRVVGDSIEVCSQFDLVLLGSNLEHAWEQQPGEVLQDVAAGHKIRELVIQFPPDLLSESFLSKNHMASLHQLLENSKRGVCFGLPVIMRIFNKLNALSEEKPGFPRVLKLLDILYQLSTEEDYRLLSSAFFSHAEVSSDSRRIRKVEEYISQNFQKEVRLNTLASIAGMTPTAFSRFFKTHTGRTLSDYIINFRLGYAARQLVDTTSSIVEICYDSGFNNISNFNRIFKKNKGCSPSTFRETYRKNKIVV